MKKTIGIIVDGPGDFHSIKRRFNQFRVMKTGGPRGGDVSIDEMIRGSLKDYAILRDYSCKRVVLLCDLEGRSNYLKFFSDLKKAITNYNLPLPTIVVVANQMIENWYLADVAFLSGQFKFLRNISKQKYYEGTHGKRELKKLFERNYSYKETDHGPKLFNKLRVDNAIKFSTSFRLFINAAMHAIKT